MSPNSLNPKIVLSQNTKRLHTQLLVSYHLKKIEFYSLVAFSNWPQKKKVIWNLLHRILEIKILFTLLSDFHNEDSHKNCLHELLEEVRFLHITSFLIKRGQTGNHFIFSVLAPKKIRDKFNIAMWIMMAKWYRNPCTDFPITTLLCTFLLVHIFNWWWLKIFFYFYFK